MNAPSGHVVISQTWLLDGDEHLDAYRTLAADFDAFLRAQPGFRHRLLVHSLDDPAHIIHVRVFDTIDDYEAMTTLPRYQAHIAALSEHVDVSRHEGRYPREYGEVLVETDGQ